MKIELIIRLHYLINSQNTGSPKDLAKRLSLSERSVYNYIGFMRRDLRAPIKYDANKNTYYYYEEARFCFVWLKKQSD